MTPDQARDLLDGTTPGPWFFDDAIDGRVLKVGPIAPYGYELECSTDDAALAAHAPTLAAMRAEMREEWGITYTGVNHGGRHTEWDYETRDEAERQARRYRLCTDMHPVGVVRRYVTKPEEIK